jgi:hypothetical protein
MLRRTDQITGLPMSRWKAAGIHLLISISIAVAIGVLFLFVWYPPPYLHAAGADELIVLLVGVDVAFGPLLTLIVFRSNKPSLKFDLTVIAIVQLVALVYGLNVVLQSRPVFLVAVADQIELVSANELEASDLAAGKKPEFQTLSWTGPRLVGAQLPADAEERSTVAFSAALGKDVQRYPKYYVDFSTIAKDLVAHARPVSELPIVDETSNQALEAAVKSAAIEKSELLWVPLKTRRDLLTMLIRRSDGSPVKAIAVDPQKMRPQQ